MSAIAIRKMGVNRAVPPSEITPIHKVNSGYFIIVTKKRRRLYFVAWGNEGLHPVKSDGTISRNGTKPDENDVHQEMKVEVYTAVQIPGLQIVDDKIVWAK